jgi:hypothetical protein
MPGGSYVVAALVFVLALAGAAYEGWHQRDRLAVAEIGSIRSEAETKVAKAEKLAAETSERVVIRYKDRIQTIRVVEPEVAHEVQVIRDSKCVLPREWVRLHDAGAGVPSQAPGSADAAASEIDCATAIETVRENYTRAAENSAQLEALQEWVKGVAP